MISSRISKLLTPTGDLEEYVNYPGELDDSFFTVISKEEENPERGKSGFVELKKVHEEEQKEFVTQVEFQHKSTISAESFSQENELLTIAKYKEIGILIPRFDVRSIKDDFQDSQFTDPKSEWTMVYHKGKEERVYTKKIAGSNVQMICGIFHLKKVDYNMAAKVIHQADEFTEWDKSLKACRFVRKINEESDVIHMTPNMPLMISKRDLVQYRKFYYDMDDRAHYVFAKSIEDPLAPVKKGVIRMETLKGAYKICECPLNSNDCYVRFIFQNDPKGLIPKQLINMGASKMFGGWSTRFMKGYKRHIQVHGA